MNADDQKTADLLIDRACEFLQELERDYVVSENAPMSPKHGELLMLIRKLDKFRRRDEIDTRGALEALKTADGLKEHLITEVPKWS